MKILAIIALWIVIICSILGLVGWRNHYMGEKVVIKYVHLNPPPQKKNPLDDIAEAEMIVINHIKFECAPPHTFTNITIESDNEFHFDCQ